MPNKFDDVILEQIYLSASQEALLVDHQGVRHQRLVEVLLAEVPLEVAYEVGVLCRPFSS